jgi:hypothetical protein
MIGHDLARYHTVMLDGLPKERLCTCGIAMLAQEHIHHDAILVDGSIQVPLVALAKEEHLVDEPAPADRRSTAPDRSRQSGPEGLDPVEDSPMRDIDTTLGQELQHLPAGQWVGQIPAYGGQDDVGWPAVAAEG